MGKSHGWKYKDGFEVVLSRANPAPSYQMVRKLWLLLLRSEGAFSILTVNILVERRGRKFEADCHGYEAPRLLRRRKLAMESVVYFKQKSDDVFILCVCLVFGNDICHLIFRTLSLLPPSFAG